MTQSMLAVASACWFALVASGTVGLASVLVSPLTAEAQSKQACINQARVTFRAAKQAAKDQLRADKQMCRGMTGGGGAGTRKCFEATCSGGSNLQVCDNSSEDGVSTERECARVSRRNGAPCECRVVEGARCSTGGSLASGGRCILQ
jgi:hypothetical protein